MKQKDTLYHEQIANPGDFVFDERVVRVFPDMINRSVPGYGLIIPMIGLLARRYAQAGSVIYDLGCSLGAAALAMREVLCVDVVKIVAMDNSRHMMDRLRGVLAKLGEGVPIELVQEDIRTARLSNASVVVLNFTLQFIDPRDRLPLLQKIALGLRPGGILILSEKLQFDDTLEQKRQTEWHHDFKRSQGYSELEIARKREALEAVMKPDTERTHRKRLQEAGFVEVYSWYRAFNFASFIAFR